MRRRRAGSVVQGRGAHARGCSRVDVQRASSRSWSGTSLERLDQAHGCVVDNLECSGHVARSLYFLLPVWGVVARCSSLGGHCRRRAASILPAAAPPEEAAEAFPAGRLLLLLLLLLGRVPAGRHLLRRRRLLGRGAGRGGRGGGGGGGGAAVLAVLALRPQSPLDALGRLQRGRQRARVRKSQRGRGGGAALLGLAWRRRRPPTPPSNLNRQPTRLNVLPRLRFFFLRASCACRAAICGGRAGRGQRGRGRRA